MAMLLFGMVFFGLISVYLGQDYNWDLKFFHYYGAYAFFNDRLLFDLAPAIEATYLNPLLDLPFYIFNENLPPKWTAFSLGALHGINFFMVYTIAYTLFSYKESRLYIEDASRKRMSSFACAIVGTLGAVNISELGATFHDNIISIFVLGSLFFIIKWLACIDEKAASYTRKQIRNGIIIAGIVMGLAAGAKLVGLIFVLGALAAIPVLMRNTKEKFFAVILFGASVFVGMLVTHGYWSYIMWKNFESPLFPFFNNIFRSPYADMTAVFEYRFFPKSLTQTLFYPFYFASMNRTTSEVYFRDIRFAVVYSLIVLAFIRAMIARFSAGRNLSAAVTSAVDRRLSLFFAIFFIVSYIVWQGMFSIYRYTATLEFLCPIIIVLLLSYILSGLKKKALPVTVAIIFALMLSTVQYPAWGRIYWSSDSYFDVKVPEIDFKENSIVIFPFLEAMSFIIPSFPEHVRFVSLQEVTPNPNKIKVMVSDLISKQTDPMYAIMPRYKTRGDLNEALSVLDQHKLELVENSCMKIETKKNIHTRPYAICEIRKVKQTL